MRTIIFMFLFVICGYLFSQNVVITYDYDEASNRISRKVIEIPLNIKSGSVKDSVTTELLIETVVSEYSVKVYPNPTYGQVNIEILGLYSDERGSIVVSDMQGRVLVNQQNISQAMQIDFSPFAAGRYNMVLSIAGKQQYFAIIREQ